MRTFFRWRSHILVYNSDTRILMLFEANWNSGWSLVLTFPIDCNLQFLWNGSMGVRCYGYVCIDRTCFISCTFVSRISVLYTIFHSSCDEFKAHPFSRAENHIYLYFWLEFYFKGYHRLETNGTKTEIWMWTCHRTPFHCNCEKLPAITINKYIFIWDRT